MAYNNGFPMNYPQYYPQYQAPVQTPNQPTQNASIIWVQGEAGAKSYLVAPNTTVQLWDSEAQTIYLKSADASGMPSMKVLDYTIRDGSTQNVSSALTESPNLDSFLTKEEFHTFEEKVQKRLDKLTRRAKREDEDDE